MVRAADDGGSARPDAADLRPRQPLRGVPPRHGHPLVDRPRRGIGRVVGYFAAGDTNVGFRLVAAALVTGTGVSLWQGRRAREAAVEAGQRADESRQVVDHLVADVFGIAPEASRSVDDRRRAPGPRRRHRRRPVSVEPLVEASVRIALVGAHPGNLWEQERAGPHAACAAELRSRLLGPEHPETLQPYASKHRSCAMPAGRTGPGMSTRLPSRGAAPADPAPFRCAPRDVGSPVVPSDPAQFGRLDEAQAEVGRAEALALRTLGPDHPTTLGVWDAMGQIVAACGDRGRRLVLLRRVAAGREGLLGPLDPETINAVENPAGPGRARIGAVSRVRRRLYLDVMTRGPCVRADARRVQLPHVRVDRHPPAGRRLVAPATIGQAGSATSWTCASTDPICAIGGRCGSAIRCSTWRRCPSQSRSTRTSPSVPLKRPWPWSGPGTTPGKSSRSPSRRTGPVRRRHEANLEVDRLGRIESRSPGRGRGTQQPDLGTTRPGVDLRLRSSRPCPDPRGAAARRTGTRLIRTTRSARLPDPGVAAGPSCSSRRGGEPDRREVAPGDEDWATGERPRSSPWRRWPAAVYRVCGSPPSVSLTRRDSPNDTVPEGLVSRSPQEGPSTTAHRP